MEYIRHFGDVNAKLQSPKLHDEKMTSHPEICGNVAVVLLRDLDEKDNVGQVTSERILIPCIECIKFRFIFFLFENH